MLVSRVKPLRFLSVRSHILTKDKKPRKGLSNGQIYDLKKSARIARQQAIILDEERKEFFEWIEAIQIKLKLSNTKYANLLGITCQTVKLWKRRSGHYPSPRSFRKLLELERMAELEVEDLKLVIGIAA